MNHKLGILTTLVIVVIITLHVLFILISPNTHCITKFIENGVIYQVRIMPLSYYNWGSFFYGFLWSFMVFLLYVLFVLFDNTTSKIACLSGMCFYGLMDIFFIAGIFKGNILMDYVSSLNFELTFGVIAFIVIGLFLILRK